MHCRTNVSAVEKANPSLSMVVKMVPASLERVSGVPGHLCEPRWETRCPNSWSFAIPPSHQVQGPCPAHHHTWRSLFLHLFEFTFGIRCWVLLGNSLRVTVPFVFLPDMLAMCWEVFTWSCLEPVPPKPLSGCVFVLQSGDRGHDSRESGMAQSSIGA